MRYVQEKVLGKLLEAYSKTEYGKDRGSKEISTIKEYREKFPVITYKDLEPYIEKVLRGDWKSLLSEPPVWFGATSGSRGIPKLIPLIPSDLRDRLDIMMDGMKIITRNFRIKLQGKCLCIYFPSRILNVKVGEMSVPCGYISGIYASLFEKAGLPVKPSVEEMDRIGDGTSFRDWRKRFDLVYQCLKDEDVGFAVGAAYALYQLGVYMKKRYGVLPRDLWNISFILCAGEPYISQYYEADLKKMYGRDVVVVEGYGATEGLFAMRLDEKPYLTPFYDHYFFEVEVKGEVKMLHEMKGGEVGRLIVSTRVLPRYAIGDLIKCYEEGKYYRVIGRDTLKTRVLITLGDMLEAAISIF